MKRQYTLVLGIIAIAAVVAGVAYMRQQQRAQDIVDESSVSALVTEFGASMQKVSLSAPNAPEQISNIYAPYASSSLIAKWQANPLQAPGRTASSPWPNNIDVRLVAKQPDGSYVVHGMVYEVTSQEVAHGGVAAQFPLNLKLQKYQKQWLIFDYQPGVATSFLPKMPTTTAQ